MNNKWITPQTAELSIYIISESDYFKRINYPLEINKCQVQPEENFLQSYSLTLF